MLERGIVPIVNENDTVAIHGWKMGDNDRLAAIVSHLVSAGMLVLLTDTDGLYSADPRSGGGEPILTVRHRDPILDRVAAGAPGPVGSGGVRTKVEAVRMAAWSGIPTVIARSDRPGVIDTIVRGDAAGTYVVPGDTKLSAWKLWLAFGQQPSGTLRIDDGAVRALSRRGGSLLPVGDHRTRRRVPRGSVGGGSEPYGCLGGEGAGDNRFGSDQGPDGKAHHGYPDPVRGDPSRSVGRPAGRLSPGTGRGSRITGARATG